MYRYVIITVLLTISLAFSLENSEYESGYLTGKQDAVGEPIWFYSALFTGPLGLGASFILSPTIPQDVNSNYSGEYLDGYYDGYRDETSFKNIQFATTGFLTMALTVYTSILIVNN
jgi:hypothetical protein